MCGRYYVDKDTFEEACRLAGCSGFAGGDGFVGGDGFSGCGSFTASDGGTAGDIVPSGTAWVLRGDQGYPGAEPRYPGTEPEPCRPGTGPCIRAERMAWGFPRFDGKGLIINARAESVRERPAFRDSVEQRRCVIFARGFYEWNRSREKFTYEREDAPVLFMAGCFSRWEDGGHFVIITTAANSSVALVHDRMPLILEPEEVKQWIQDAGAAWSLLKKTPVLLAGGTEYEQLRLF